MKFDRTGEAGARPIINREIPTWRIYNADH